MGFLYKIIFITLLLSFTLSQGTATASSTATIFVSTTPNLLTDPVINLNQNPTPNQFTDPVDPNAGNPPTTTDAAASVRLSILPVLCPQKKYLQSLSDSDLFTEGLNLNVGKCYISDHRKINTTFCDYYAKVLGIANPSMSGLPDLYGTGCLVAPLIGKQRGYCWPAPNTYPNYNSTTTPICTTDHLKNGANMLRIGINKGYCGPLCNCPKKYTLLMMSDLDLVIEAYYNRVGKCVIKRGNPPNTACDFYAQVTGLPAGVANGLPDLIGTGCIVFPPFMTTCWPAPNTYPNYSGTSTPICTNDWIKNAANMIRIGLKKNRCGVC